MQKKLEDFMRVYQDLQAAGIGLDFDWSRFVKDESDQQSLLDQELGKQPKQSGFTVEPHVMRAILDIQEEVYRERREKKRIARFEEVWKSEVFGINE